MIKKRSGKVKKRTKRRVVEDESDSFEVLEAGLAFDKHALDDGLLTQSDLFHRVSKSLALTISRRDAAKQYVSEVEAEVDRRIRRKAQDSENKVTDRGIEAMKRLDDSVKDANAELHRLNKQVGLLSALKEAYQQRSYALRSLVDLHSSGYFGDAVTRSAAYSEHENAAAEGRRAMAEARRKRK